MNCSNEEAFTFGERLASTCVFNEYYTPFRWEYLVSLITVIAWFLLSRMFFDFYHRVTGGVEGFTLAAHLTKHDNPALATQLACYFFSIGLITRGSLNSLPIHNNQIGEYFYTFFTYQGLGFAFMLVIMLVNDKIILARMHNFRSIIENRNIGTACVEGGSLIASAIIVAAAADGQYTTLDSTDTEVIETISYSSGILATLVFWALGQVVLFLYIKGLNFAFSLNFGGTTEETELGDLAATAASAGSSSEAEPRPQMARRRSMVSQIETNGNVAAGLALGMDLVAAGIVIRTSIRAGFSLIAFCVWVPSALLVVMPLMHIYLDTLILRSVDYRHNILRMKNWGAAFLVGTLKILTALLLDNIYDSNCDTTILMDTGECEFPKFANELGRRLTVNALPDVLRWQSLADLFLLLLVLLFAKGLYHMRFVLRDGFGEASTHWKTFSIDDVLADPNKNAIAVSFAGYCMGQGLVLTGVSTCTDPDVGLHVGYLCAWTAIGCVLMILSQLINDNLIIMQLSNAKALIEDNMAVAMMEAGQFVATGVIICATMAGGGEDFAEGLALTILYWVLSQAMLLLFTVVYRYITVFDDLEQLKAGNVAAGVSGGLTLVALALGMSWPTRMYDSVAVFVPTALIGCFILVLLRFAIDKVILPGDKLDDEIMQVNWGAALIEGGVACAIALITNTYVKQFDGYDECEG